MIACKYQYRPENNCIDIATSPYLSFTTNPFSIKSAFTDIYLEMG